MKKYVFFWGLSSLLLLGSCSQTLHPAFQNTNQLIPEQLRCENRTEPMGIDVLEPRLSWKLACRDRGRFQTAYQIQVASRKDLLIAGQADLWDSGKVESSQTFEIVYAGKTLHSGMDCWWRVRIWDEKRQPAGWSRPARWTMGLLNPSDWHAEWIGLDLQAAPQPAPGCLQTARWIWTDPHAAQGTAPARRYFRKTFEVPADWAVKSARCWITADDSFQSFLNGRILRSFAGHSLLYEISIRDYLTSGRNVLAVTAVNDGQEPNPAGLLAVVRIETVDGRVLEFASDESWKVSSEVVENWQSPSTDDSGWSAASVVGTFGDAPWEKTQIQVRTLPPARYLRHRFSIDSKSIEKARLYVTALGVYQLYLNGRRISSDFLSPGWTDYRKRIYYRTYDVSETLRRSVNALGAIVADGWYAGYVGWGMNRNHYGTQPRLKAQLVIDYKDGTQQVIATGPEWKGSPSPIFYADLLAGEGYDARLEMPGWAEPDFDDTGWQSVSVGGQPIDPPLQAAVSEPVRVFAEVKPVSVREPVKGIYVFDMGQNFAGVVRLKVKGKPGQRIEIRLGERLNQNGTVYQINLRTAAAEDVYICKGQGQEIWQPMFTFHGFQYVEISGLDYRPGLDAVTGLAFSSDTPLAGRFECSDPLVNRLYANIVWTQRMNFIDIPTDCPQRDERLGWTGDAQVYIQTACYNNDVQPFFTKWLTDLTDAQREDGPFPRYAPPIRSGGADGGPAWADAGVICPWTIWRMYGDRRLLQTHYEPMKRFVEFSKNRCTPQLLPPRQFHCFGDWLHINDPTPNEIIFMAYFAHSSRLLSQMAEVLDRSEDARQYRQLTEQIRRAFQTAYVKPDGRIEGDSQTAYVLAIVYDLLTPEQTDKAAAHLIRRIHEQNDHLSTGFVGTKDLMLALAQIGRNDIAYQLLHNETFPSWGFTIRHGATSIWERWNGWTPEEGFADPGMNSFAHYSFGAVGQWLFEQVGGIQPLEPGFGKIQIRPSPGGKLTWARTSYESIRGTIVSNWSVDKNRFVLDVQIPPNTTAQISLPAQNPEQVCESGKPLQKIECLQVLGIQNNRLVVSVPSGRYQFTVESYIP